MDGSLDERAELHAEIARITEEVGQYVAAGGTVGISDDLAERITQGGEGEMDLASLRQLRDDVRGLLLMIRASEPGGAG